MEHEQNMGELVQILDVLSVRQPVEEFRRIAQARIETWARFGIEGTDAEMRMNDYKRALELGLKALGEEV